MHDSGFQMPDSGLGCKQFTAGIHPEKRCNRSYILFNAEEPFNQHGLEIGIRFYASKRFSDVRGPSSIVMITDHRRRTTDKRSDIN